MMKARPSSKRRPPARQRLLEAAAVVFGRDGLEGATTRAIARAAGVNEVTLFRLFQSKEKLLAAVVGETFEAPAAPARPVLPARTGDLRQDLANYARVYERMLTENLPLIRSLIGEMHRHDCCQGKKVADGIFRPLRMEMIITLRGGQERGAMGRDISAEVAVDLLGGMIFSGVLRRSSPARVLEYSPAAYLDACVEVLVRGIQNA